MVLSPLQLHGALSPQRRKIEITVTTPPLKKRTIIISRLLPSPLWWWWWGGGDGDSRRMLGIWVKGTVVLRQKAPESLLFEVGIFISLLKQQAREIWLPALYSREA